MALSNNGFIAVGNTYKEIANRYVGVDGIWKYQDMAWFGIGGKWRLGYINNQIDLSNPFIRYFDQWTLNRGDSLKFIGSGFTSYQIPHPKIMAVQENFYIQLPDANITSITNTEITYTIPNSMYLGVSDIFLRYDDYTESNRLPIRISG